ncbi:HEAT repeat domain-containing protein [Rhodopirellula bahusiensis]|uniref:HEAT repeat domain-containing protein n=1 Tax=Rhodopirellula bahusiensis TaxID=2014065 RepID=UPI003263A4A8
MKTLRAFAILCVCLAGCNQRVGQQNSTPQKTGDTANPSFDELIAAWGDMGMMLPDSAQVDVFRADFETARGALQDALSDSDDSVRMRAAYVIGELGDIAKPAGEKLLARLTGEPDELVRIYIVDALNSVGYDTDATIAALSDRFETLNGNNVPPNADNDFGNLR